LRAIVAVGSALVVVLAASRVNRPERVRLLEEPPHVADRVLAEVRLETSSLRKVLGSIDRAAPGAVRLDEASLSEDDQTTYNWPAQPPLRNVRLGKALMLGTQQWRGDDGVEWREAGGAIVVGGPGSASAPPVGRLYDVRDILDEAEAWSKPLRPLHPRPAQQGIFGGAGGRSTVQQRGLFGGGPDDVEPLRADSIASAIMDVVDPRMWDTPKSNWQACGWAGWVFVRASPRALRDVERLLALMRRGESEPARRKGASQ
jgi:hypothetical protein